MPKNFFVAKLLKVDLISRNLGKEVVYDCDICNDGKEVKEPASMFCINCEEHFCMSCSNYHLKQKMAKSHKVVAIGDEVGCEEVIKMSDSFCSEHDEKPLELYCFDCKVAICVKCFHHMHQRHKCSNIHEDAGWFYDRLDDDLTTLAVQMSKVQKEKELLVKKTVKFMEQINSMESTIIKKRDFLKYLIDIHTQSLLQQLREIKEEKLKEVEIVKQLIEREVAILESFEKYCEELKEKGTPSEIARVAENIHTGVTELEESSFECSFTDFTFTVTNLKNAEKDNLVGEISRSNKNPEAGLFKCTFQVVNYDA